MADATCTAPSTCKRADCGYTEGEALGHDWVEATADTLKTCQRCEAIEHPICGAECDCTDTTHPAIVWYPVSDLAEFTSAIANAGNYYLADDVIIEKTVKINANVNVNLNGKKITREGAEEFTMLQINSSATLTLTDTGREERIGYIDPETGLWTEGTYSGEGSATVYNLYGGVITGGNSSLGGAVYVNGGTLNLYGVNFAGNYASSNGGAIDLVGGHLNAYGDNVFVGNVAAGHAGVIYVTYLNEGATGVLEITDGTFCYNAAMVGGAISGRTGSKITITGTKLLNNSTSNATSTNGGGGALYVNNCTVTMTDVTFEGNTTTIYGGAMRIDTGATVTVNDSLFKGNSSESLGGAIFMSGSVIYLNDVVMTENTVDDHGGAVYATSSSVVNIDGGSYTKNSAERGGAIYVVSGAELNIANAQFVENTASDCGGAISTGYAIINVSGADTLFSKNTAVNYGGAIYLSNQAIGEVSMGAVLDMTNGTFSENTAFGGGAIAGRTNSQITVNGTKFLNNSAPTAVSGTNGGGGGAIYGNTCTITITGATFDGNVSNYYGGAVCTFGGAKVYINGNTVVKNSVGVTGAALYFNGSSLEADGLILQDNNSDKATNGSIYFNGGENVMANVTATGNRANNGGLFYISGGKLTITNLTASGNSANYGGVFQVSGSAAITIVDSSFTSNSANVGGAIDFRATAKMTITGSSFTSNTAAVAGGAIVANGSGELAVTDCTFTENQALATKDADSAASKISRGGGAIFVTSKGYVTVSGNSSFISNSAAGTKDSTTAGSEMTDAGGAIMVDGGTLIVSGAAFTGNTANNGAAIGTSRSTATAMNISGCTFTENYSGNNGGGIYIQNGVKNETDSIIIDDCEFVKNTAKSGSGASIYVRTNSSATITNVSVSGGTWGWKGEIYITGGARATFGGSITVEKAENVYVTGAATTAIVNYETDEEKAAWEAAITLASSATVTYVPTAEQ